MDNKKTISLKDLFRMLPARYEDVDNIDPNSKDRRGFRMTDRKELEKFEEIGFIETGMPQSYKEIDVFSEGSLIDFGVYPYFGCRLYKYGESNSHYLVYREDGGMFPN
jgi:hypothetical protein